MVYGNARPPALGARWPGHAGHHSPPPSGEVKIGWRYTSIPPTCLHGDKIRWCNSSYISCWSGGLLHRRL